jgi:precorrin-6A/cobalt-precorrin-6A reductase
MKAKPHILLLSGTDEARQIAEALESRNIHYEAWLSEAPRGAASMPQIPHLRRFDDAATMQAQMAQGFTAVIDAGHVFDRLTTARASAAAAALGLPYCRIARPDWEASDWPLARSVPDVATANGLIAPGARVFATTGWDSLPDYAGFRGEALMLRQTRAHKRQPPFPFVELVFGDPPFTVQQEQALFQALRVDLLICRNLGGSPSRTKLDAASSMGCEVILIDRPALPEGVEPECDIEAVLDWVAAL